MSKALTLIQREIARLEARSEGSTTGLSLEDVKKLETLVRTGQSLIASPVQKPATPAATKELSDAELDEIAKNESSEPSEPS